MNFGEPISIIGVKYILLTKEVDYKKYFFLFNQSDLELVLETENFYVFKNKAFKGLMFSVDGISYVKDWDELINVSKTEDITKRLYLISNDVIDFEISKIRDPIKKYKVKSLYSIHTYKVKVDDRIRLRVKSYRRWDLKRLMRFI